MTSECLRGRRYVVTGAASGIGDAVARGFAELGAEVISLDRHKPSAPVAQHVEVDLANESWIDRALDVLDGSFDGLCNVAGVPGTAPREMVFAVNFLGLRHVTNGLVPRLKRGGAVVNVASTAGIRWSERRELCLEALETTSFADGARWFADHAPADEEIAPYHFSKEILTLYTMREALTFAARGQRIVAVSPGPVRTPILPEFERSMGKPLLDGVRAMVGRHAWPADIAPAVIFLASPAARWINGQNVIADGGAVAGVMSGAAESLSTPAR